MVGIFLNLGSFAVLVLFLLVRFWVCWVLFLMLNLGGFCDLVVWLGNLVFDVGIRLSFELGILDSFLT